MKINGPGQPPPVGAEGVGPSSTPPGAPDTAGRASGAGSAAGSEVTEAGRKFAENLAANLEKTAAPRGPGAASATHGAPVALTDLVKEVEAGRLDARTAVDQLVERVVDAQLGPGAPAAVRDRVQAALRDALESDPLLAAKLGQLSRLTD